MNKVELNKVGQPKTAHLAPYIDGTDVAKMRIDDMVREISSSLLNEAKCLPLFSQTVRQTGSDTESASI